MSGQLVGDLMEWRRTPAAAGLTDKEFIVLLAIADRVLHPRTRLMKRFNGDDCKLYERLCQVADVKPDSLKDILQRLADRGMEVRVIWKHDKNGHPVYAGRGHAMEFRFPELPESVSLPPSGTGPCL